MKWISFRIRNTPEHPYLDQIIAGSKVEEFRALSPHWQSIVSRCLQEDAELHTGTPGPGLAVLRICLRVAGDKGDSGCNLRYDVGAVFFNRRIVHRRRVTGFKFYRDSQQIEKSIGRPLSDQGKADLGDGMIVGFRLGEELHVP